MPSRTAAHLEARWETPARGPLGFPIGLPVVLGLLVVLAGCDAEGPARSGLVARAGDHTLTVDETTALLEDQGQIATTESVVRTVADLWVDYTLLAEAARRDPSLESLDLDPLLTPQLEQELVVEFRDSVVAPDTAFTEEELRRAYETEGSGVQAQARHILLSFPQDATPEQRDSVEQLARELRRRVTEGEDFGALARQYSDDTGSASQGGDLGSFGRGDMVPAFEEAAFALDSGEVSEPVETPYGLHIIELLGRETPSFEENRERFARQLRSRRLSRAESVYVSGLEEPAEVQVPDDAFAVVRELANRPGSALSSRARRRPLVRYRGGAVTAGEVRTFLQGRSPQERSQVVQASQEQVELILRNLARRELILAEARETGFEISEARRDSLRTELRERLRQAVAQVGLDSIAQEEGETATQAVDRAVDELLRRTLAGRQQILPLGNLSFTLRDEAGAEVHPVGISLVVERLTPDPSGEEAGGASPTPAPDTTP